MVDRKEIWLMFCKGCNTYEYWKETGRVCHKCKFTYPTYYDGERKFEGYEDDEE